MGGGTGAEVVVIETVGKNNVDSGGYKWPDEVVLVGEAKKIREWSAGYGLGGMGKRRKSRDEEKVRVGGKRFEAEIGLEKV